jgi:hypothetical protein
MSGPPSKPESFFSLYFSLLPGNLKTETGSIVTASATNQSRTAEISRSGPKTHVLAPSRPVDLVSGFSHSCDARLYCGFGSVAGVAAGVAGSRTHFGDRSQHLPPMPERNADILEILIV